MAMRINAPACGRAKLGLVLAPAALLVLFEFAPVVDGTGVLSGPMAATDRGQSVGTLVSYRTLPEVSPGQT